MEIRGLKIVRVEFFVDLIGEVEKVRIFAVCVIKELVEEVFNTCGFLVIQVFVFVVGLNELGVLRHLVFAEEFKIEVEVLVVVEKSALFLDDLVEDVDEELDPLLLQLVTLLVELLVLVDDTHFASAQVDSIRRVEVLLQVGQTANPQLVNGEVHVFL